MKKMTFFATALAASALVSGLALKGGGMLRASAAWEQTDQYYYYDTDNDGSYDGCFIFDADINTKKATIKDIYSYDGGNVVIPPVMENVDIWYSDDEGYYTDVKTYNFTVTAIDVPVYDYDYWHFTSVEIPYTVTAITPESLGYYTDYYYDEELDEYVSCTKRYEDMTIFCTRSTAGETYASENGFDFTVYEYLALAKMTLPASSYTYTGKAITPTPTITLDGQKLVKNKDYTITYSSNTNAGTAKFTVTGIGNFRGKLSGKFTIGKKSAASAKIAAVAQQNYTGKAISPGLNITLGGVKLVSGKDYTVKYSANTNPGTAKAVVTFKGNYSGSKSVSFKIAIAKMKNVKVAATSNKGIKLTWGKIPCDKYYIYRYDTKSKSYKLIKTTTATSYTNTNLSQTTKYTYRIKAGKTVKGKTYFDQSVTVAAYTKPSAPTKFSLAVKNKAIKVSWSKNSKASGYQIYRSSDYGYSYKLVKTVTSPSTVSWTNTGLSNDKYYVYRIRSYKKIGNTTYYGGFKYAYSDDPLSRLNAASLKPHRSFKVYNRQGKGTTSYTYTLSDRDIKILKNFAAKHFKSGMTRDEKLWVTLNWINKNVTYALGSDWNQISSKSWVDAIFTYKKGQCAQYNGALTAMMAYLGYDVSLVQGYRGVWSSNYWQHFWCELKIDGMVYVMETGNYGRNGNWMYFVARYNETSGYIRNRVNM